MNLGEVFSWITSQALGHQLRDKMHVFMCEEDGFDGHTFLFISTIDYGGDFKILQADYPSFLTHDSYISLGRPVCYSDADLNSYTKQQVGQIRKDHLQQLFHAVQGSDTMEARYIKRVGNALKAAL